MTYDEGAILLGIAEAARELMMKCNEVIAGPIPLGFDPKFTDGEMGGYWHAQQVMKMALVEYLKFSIAPKSAEHWARLIVRDVVETGESVTSRLAYYEIGERHDV